MQKPVEGLSVLAVFSNQKQRQLNIHPFTKGECTGTGQKRAKKPKRQHPRANRSILTPQQSKQKTERTRKKSPKKPECHNHNINKSR